MISDQSGQQAAGMAASPLPAKRATFLPNLVLCLTLLGIVYFFSHNFATRERGTDFPVFFTAAHMVYEGFGHQLYNVETQDRFQIRDAGRTGDYYIHPPFETLIFLPLSLWSMQTAYVLWCLLNMGVLAHTAIMFQQHVFHSWSWRVLLPLFLIFPPVLVSFFQGQDSLLLLWLFTLSFVELKQDRGFAAGCFLALALFKFHIVLTLALLVTSLGRKHVAAGFTLTATVLLLISLAISGWGFLTMYPRFLMTLRSLPMGGIHPNAMANLRGFIGVTGLFPSTMQLAMIGASSLLVLWRAWRAFDQTALKSADLLCLAFGNFVLAAVLVSYHLSPPDLCIVLLPMGLFGQYLPGSTLFRQSVTVTLLASMAILFLPPLHIITLARHAYCYLVIPILLMFLLTSSANFAKSHAEAVTH